MQKRELSPLYVGPYEILQRVGKVSCELRLRSEFGFGLSNFPCFYDYNVYQ